MGGAAVGVHTDWRWKWGTEREADVEGKVRQGKGLRGKGGTGMQRDEEWNGKGEKRGGEP